LAASAGAQVPAAQLRSEADWIMASQLPSGAITEALHAESISPYLANYAAMGLARATQLSGRSWYAQAAWRWLHWYQAHQTAQGFVYDYVTSGGSETTKGAMDSTDAYAGTFLLALQAAWQATHDQRELRALAPGMAAAVRAIEATQDIDGLTWAKPGFSAKYLMDQAEAYAGLRAGSVLAAALGEPSLSLSAMLDAAWMSSGVAQLWNSRAGAYDWARHGNGATKPTDWSVLYPDAFQQAWAVAFGLVSGARARALMARFADAQPNWDDPAALARFDSGNQPVGYWPAAGWAFANVGDGRRSDQAASKIEAAAGERQRAWPFTVSAAGQLILLAGGDPPLAPVAGPEPGEAMSRPFVQAALGLLGL
jgi:hypothetical protein